VFVDEDLETVTQLVEGMKTTKLMARVRHTGRMLGNFRTRGTHHRETDNETVSKCVFSVLPRVGIALRKYFT
jgi:hypothetical protein